MFKTATAVLAIGSALTFGVAASASGDDTDQTPGNPSEAIYGDRIINLADGWGGAAACIELGVETRCYDTEADLQEAHPQPRAACASGTRLYDGTSYGGSALYLTTRSTYINLSGHGFNNVTSSYKIGACGASFFDGAGGGGAVYPGSTGAGASATAMATGWDNRISSIYIY